MNRHVGLPQLTRRELLLLELTAQGLRLADIAQQMFVSLATARAHTRFLLEKLGARNRTHAVAIGYQRGLLAIDAAGVERERLACELEALAERLRNAQPAQDANAGSQP